MEPIGPEHSVEEIAEKILIGREMNPCYSGVARRISIPGSALEKFGMISEYRMAYLVAVVRLAMGRELIGNCTHEPNLLGATAGANLFWAEAGANPRDTEPETSKGRGLDRECLYPYFPGSRLESTPGAFVDLQREQQEDMVKNEISLGNKRGSFPGCALFDDPEHLCRRNEGVAGLSIRQFRPSG